MRYNCSNLFSINYSQEYFLKYGFCLLFFVMVNLPDVICCSYESVVVTQGSIHVQASFPAQQAIILKSGAYKIQSRISFSTIEQQALKIDGLKKAFVALMKNRTIEEMNQFTHMYLTGNTITCSQVGGSLGRFFPDGSRIN
jgi:hypothetical protein